MTESVVDMSDKSNDVFADFNAPDRPYTEYDRGYDDGYLDGEGSRYAEHQAYLRSLLGRFRDFVADHALTWRIQTNVDEYNRIFTEVAEAISGTSDLSSHTPDQVI